MTELEPLEPEENPDTRSDPDSGNDHWNATMAALRTRYPQASDGILFCINKLEQNDRLRIVDFRDEARLYGINPSGRALHSARVLLGLEQPARRRTKRELEADILPDPDPPVEQTPEQPNGNGVEDMLIQAVQQIQTSATNESQKLREAIRAATELLRQALDD